MVLVAGGVTVTLLSRARNCTTRRAGPGLPQAASTPHAIHHTATLLPNGMVLVAGGVNATLRFASAELYDPASGTWTATGSLNTARIWPHGDLAAQRHGAGCRGIGLALRCFLASAELYDPASGTWTATGSLNTARVNHTATLLPNGMVLAVGERTTGVLVLSSAELYATHTLTPTPTATATGTATLTATATATATATTTATPLATPPAGTRATPTPRARPTPPPRP